MSIVTKSTLVYPDRQGTTFKAEDQIEFYIPPSLHLINTKSTFLLFDLNMTGNLKKAVSSSAGVFSLFKSITLSSGNSEYNYENLQDPGIQQAIYYYYSKIAGNNLRELHEGKPSSDVLGYDSANQYTDGLATTAATAHKKVEVCLPLYMSGILSPNREKIFPNVATSGLRIRIILNTAVEGLTVTKTRVGVAATGAAPSPDEDLTRNNVGAYNVNFQCRAAGGDANLVVDRQIDVSHANFNNVNRALLFNQTSGGAGAPQVSHPFVVGQTLTENTGGGFASTRKIEGITQDANGKIVLAMSGGNIAAGTGYAMRIDSSSSNNTNENFEINNLRLQVSYAVAEPSYLEAIQRSVAANKMTIDIDTWTDYAINVPSGSLQNQLYIKSVNNRAKSLISVPIKVASGASILEDSMASDQQNCQDYQYTLYGINVPNRPVRIGRFIKEDGDQKASFSGSAVKEMSHAFSAAGYELNNIKYPWRRFFLGRKLANEGYSMNLNQEGDVRLSLSFNSSGGPVATLVHNCVHHIRRITVGPNQQMVTL